MYPDESIKDSPAEKRRKLYARLFWVFLVTTLLLAASSLYLNFNSLAQPDSVSGSEPVSTASPSPSSTSTDITSDSAEVEKCNSVVETMPGDLAYVLTLGWEIKCIEGGADPDLGDNGLLDELYTVGYADPAEKMIAIDAPEVTAAIIAHEAAHALDFEQLLQADIDAMAAEYGEKSWDEGSDYWNTPAEMFAEGRTRCLGYDADPDFANMSCEDVDSLIAGTAQAEKINEMANSNS
jgi:hypothetical protein